MDDFYCVITFHTTQEALAFEKFFKEIGFSIKLMPIPRQISSSCGLSAKIPCKKKEKIFEICEEKKIEFDEFHKIVKKQRKSWLLSHIKKTTQNNE